jgi:hypothetical protein
VSLFAICYIDRSPSRDNSNRQSSLFSRPALSADDVISKIQAKRIACLP